MIVSFLSTEETMECAIERRVEKSCLDKRGT
jgi:hypothetical protein